MDQAAPKARNAQKRIAARFDGMKSKAKGGHAKIFRKKARPTHKE
jgi:hypothetical protein